MITSIKNIERLSTSLNDVGDAIQNAVTAASQSLENVDWFDVSKVRGEINDGEFGHVQVDSEVGFRLTS